MKKIAFVFVIFLVLSVAARAAIQFTIHVTSATTFEVWMMPDATITTGAAGISRLGMTFETPSAVNPSGSPSSSPGLWGVVSNPALFPSSPALLSTQFKKNAAGNWESNFNWNNGSGAGNQTLAAGTEYLLATFTLPAGLAMSDITVKDWGNNKVDNSGSPLWGISVAMGVAPDGVESPSAIFYPTAGSTASVSNSGAASATSTMTLVPLALSVHFLSFDAGRSGQTAWLKWQTAGEENVKNFLVERSVNSIDWTTLGAVAALGGAGTNGYSYTDDNPASGVNYYRIAEQDLDGKLTYTGERLVSFGDEQGLWATLYPVPAVTTLLVTVHSPVSGPAGLRIADMGGRTVLTREITLGRGAAGLPPVDGPFFAKGAP